MTTRPDPYIAAVVQLGIDSVAEEATIDQDIRRNGAKMVEWIRFLCESATTPPKLIVFPLTPLTGSRARPVAPTRTPMRGQAPTEPALDPIIAACARHGCYVSMSILEQPDGLDGEFLPIGLLLSGDGVVLRQPKFQPHGAWENEVTRAKFNKYAEVYGEASLDQVIDTPIGRIGSILDRDLLIPEVGRARAKAGAELVVHPSFSWYDVDMPFVALRQAYAFQNCFYLLTANPAFERWTHEGQPVFHRSRGNSMITGPGGEILARCNSESEGFALATIDLNKAAEAREGHGQVSLPLWEMHARTYGS